jgi:hypothetical protein
MPSKFPLSRFEGWWVLHIPVSSPRGLGWLKEVHIGLRNTHGLSIRVVQLRLSIYFAQMRGGCLSDNRLRENLSLWPPSNFCVPYPCFGRALFDRKIRQKDVLTYLC